MIPQQLLISLTYSTKGSSLSLLHIMISILNYASNMFDNEKFKDDIIAKTCNLYLHNSFYSNKLTIYWFLLGHFNKHLEHSNFKTDHSNKSSNTTHTILLKTWYVTRIQTKIQIMWNYEKIPANANESHSFLKRLSYLHRRRHWLSTFIKRKEK